MSGDDRCRRPHHPCRSEPLRLKHSGPHDVVSSTASNWGYPGPIKLRTSLSCP
jgi:hypothetical protein